MTASTQSIRQLIIRHVDAFQRSNQIHTTQTLNKLQHELTELSLCDQMNNVELDQTEATTTVPEKEEIEAAIIHCTDCALSCTNKVEVMERLGQILAAIANQYGTVDMVLDRLKGAANAAQDVVRVKGCRLIAPFFEYSPEFVEGLLEPRFSDKAQAVRNAALKAASSLNSSTLQKASVWNCNHDPSWSNRNVALASMKNLEDIIPRVRDTKSQVRVQAIKKLHETPLQEWTSQQCANVIQAGLINERCSETNEATKVMVCTRWMKAAKYNPIKLLSHLQPFSFEAECEAVVKILLDASDDILKDLSDAEIRAFRQGLDSIPTEVAPEKLLFARLKCKDRPDRLNRLIPDISCLCDCIEESLHKLASIVEKSQETESDSDEEMQLMFLCNQLFKLAHLCDLQEEGSRRLFITKCKLFLTSLETPEELLDEALQALRQANVGEQEHFDVVAEIIRELDSPPNNELAQLRIISILSPVLESTSTNLPDEQQFKHHALSAIESGNALLREAGVACLGRLALFSEKCEPILLEIMAKEEEKMEIRAQAILALSDWAMLHSDDSITEKLQTFIFSLLAGDHAPVVAVAAEVATKLLLAGRFHSPDLMASLLCIFFDKYYDEMEEEDIEVGSVYRMQQLLSLFFPAYSMKNQDNKMILVSAMAPMLAKVTYDRPKGQRRSWPIARLVEFIYSTIQEGNEGTEQEIALLVCQEMASFLIHAHEKMNVTHLRTLSRLLGGADIDVETCDKRILLELKEKVNELSMLITDSTCLESMETILELLEDIPEEDASKYGESKGDKLAEAFDAVDLVDKENAGNSINIISKDFESSQPTLTEAN